MTEPSLVQLAERILEHARKIESGVPRPPTTVDDTISELPAELRPTRLAAIDDIEKLNALIRGSATPQGRIWRRMGHFRIADDMVLHTTYSLRVPQAVPLEGSIPYNELAAKCGVDEGQLTRILRYGMTIDLFYEPEPGRVAHTVDTKRLVTEPSLFDMVGFEMEDVKPAAQSLVEALKRYPGSQEPNETAFNLHFKHEGSWYAWFARDPELQRRLGMAFVQLSCGSAEVVRGTATGYPFETVAGGAGTLVDIGGGSGHISVAIAEHHTAMHFVVQDLPGASAAGEAALPAHLKDRVTYTVHDYYQPQPVKDADFYFLSMVLHNQSDKYVLKVLQQLIPALKPGAKVLWCDRVIPKRGAVPECEYREIVATDVCMMMLLNSCERNVEEEVRLLELADHRLKHTGTFRLPGGQLYTIVEATWMP